MEPDSDDRDQVGSGVMSVGVTVVLVSDVEVHDLVEGEQPKKAGKHGVAGVVAQFQRLRYQV